MAEKNQMLLILCDVSSIGNKTDKESIQTRGSWICRMDEEYTKIIIIKKQYIKLNLNFLI